MEYSYFSKSFLESNNVVFLVVVNVFADNEADFVNLIYADLPCTVIHRKENC